MKKMPITREGLENLNKQLIHLQKVERPDNIRAIAEARSHGDLSENAEYHAAKERQSFIEGKMNELKT
ncbi:MAG: transcription elongation factor GreA, partial [Desulfobulbaceae bacterium]|nr:transcription elongation factor GreA [Desulfobulbaceae bacterium]